jgi:hypothetical protein
MEKHVSLLAAFYIALGVLGLLAAFIVFVVIVGGGLLSGNASAIRIVSGVGTLLGSFLAVISIPDLVCGIGLLRRARWARMLGLILGFLNLLHIPLGTVVGVYGIWVLFQDETVRIFEGRPTEPSAAPGSAG